jgi:hypothetical protein
MFNYILFKKQKREKFLYKYAVVYVHIHSWLDVVY